MTPLRRHPDDEDGEPVTRLMPSRKPGPRAPIAPRPGERPPTREQSDAQESVQSSDLLTAPPVIGRIAGNWQRRLKGGPWAEPTLAADYGSAGPWVVAAASTLGRTHGHRAQERQDAYGLLAVGETFIAAIADGVSGATFGGPAAHAAVDAALHALELPRREAESANSDLAQIGLAVDEAAIAVRSLAARAGADADDCATTLLIVAAKPPARFGKRLEVDVVSVGDSSLLELRQDSSLKVLLGPGYGGSSPDLEDFLPRPESAVVRRRFDVARSSTLILATDGFAQDLSQSEAVRRWATDQLHRARSPVDAAHVLSYQRQRSNDDLTFVALRRRQ